MGLFSGIKNTYKKSEAAVIVQNLLEHQQKVGDFDSDPGSTANRLVGDLWDSKPDLFNGSFGQRPHKLSVAAAALAEGLTDQWPDEGSRNAVLICLGIALSEVERNGALYPFNGIDEQLITLSVSKFQEESSAGTELAAVVDEVLKSGGCDDQPGYIKPTTSKEASDFLDTQIANGKMTNGQFDAICNMLSMGVMMTGNLQEAYEMMQGKPVDTNEFSAWLSDDDEGRWWHAAWVILRKGQSDTKYNPV